MEPQPERLRRPPAERFAGTEHVFDLTEVARQLRAEPHPAKDGHRQMTIFHQGGASIVLFDFEEGGRLVDHVADGLVTIHSLAGLIEVKTRTGTYQMEAGTLLVLAPGAAHDLYARGPSQVLLTVQLEARA
jgi:quercetin dioxygenase-like cupin family protein